MIRYAVVMYDNTEEVVGEYWGFITMELAEIVAEILTDTVEEVAFLTIEEYTLSYEEWTDLLEDEEER